MTGVQKKDNGYGNILVSRISCTFDHMQVIISKAKAACFKSLSPAILRTSALGSIALSRKVHSLRNILNTDGLKRPFSAIT